MRRISLFMNVSLDGYFEAPGNDLSWSVSEIEPFSEGSQGTDAILLGHRTYEMMKAFWPTPQAMETAPAVARFMNETQKLVASRQPFDPGWERVTVLAGDVLTAVRELKARPGRNIILLGSNALCVSLMQAGLIDEFQILLNPVVIGQGTSLFAGLKEKARLELVDTRRFKSGAVLLTYQTAR